MSRQHKPPWREIITYTLQSLSYGVGIAIGIKELFFRKTVMLKGVEGGVFTAPIDWILLIHVAGLLVVFTLLLMIIRRT